MSLLDAALLVGGGASGVAGRSSCIAQPNGHTWLVTFTAADGPVESLNRSFRERGSGSGLMGLRARGVVAEMSSPRQTCAKGLREKS